MIWIIVSLKGKNGATQDPNNISGTRSIIKSSRNGSSVLIHRITNRLTENSVGRNLVYGASVSGTQCVEQITLLNFRANCQWFIPAATVDLEIHWLANVSYTNMHIKGRIIATFKLLDDLPKSSQQKLLLMRLLKTRSNTNKFPSITIVLANVALAC